MNPPVSNPITGIISNPISNPIGAVGIPAVGNYFFDDNETSLHYFDDALTLVHQVND